MTAARKIADHLVEAAQPFCLLLDSGAFTAWSQGHEVTLDDLFAAYDEMIATYGDKAEEVWLISLDKIPGSKGRTATPDEINEACRISDENFKILTDRYGDRVLPVFHQNESTSRLHEVAAMADYICVSPRNDLPEKSRVRWSAEVHARIPGKRTHGLAATGKGMMQTVPWYSVDSASSIFAAMNGGIYRNSSLQVLQMSTKSSSIKDMDQHFRTLPSLVQEHLVAEFERRGFTLEGLEESIYERIVWNRILMVEFSRALHEDRNIPTEIPLFDL